MFEYIKWITLGVIVYAVMSLMSPAYSGEVKSNAVKQPTVIEQKITAVKDWAVKSGAEFKAQQIKNMAVTKDALHKDWSWSEGGRFTYPLKNAWEDAKAQVRKDSKTVTGYWQNIANALSGLAPKKQ